ncbi:hypothetical protein RN001_014506 [Aquatica leii]|uniref:Uncharacterized protein n=1 Tax=Aquatica leii TaxID=1421715 RepID=A0AAN7SBG9_9COLE|nr:hypothetical protein RN001_014506 [Aquatica leii]
MSSPTPTDPLSEKTEMPIFDTPTPPPPKQTSADEHPKVDIALQVLFIVLKLIMFIAGVVNINDCPQQPMVPIYLIVAGLLGVSIKLIHGVNNKVEIKVITIMVQALIVIEFIWMIIGCYFIFSIYQPNYSPYFGRMYCERHRGRERAADGFGLSKKASSTKMGTSEEHTRDKPFQETFFEGPTAAEFMNCKVAGCVFCAGAHVGIIKSNVIFASDVKNFSTMEVTVKEIDDELRKIDEKYNNSDRGNRNDTYLEQLLREFDSLGINCEDEDVVTNTLKVISMYRKTLSQVQECKSVITKVKVENLELKKQINALEKKLSDESIVINDLQKKSVLTRIDQDQLRSDKKKLHGDLKSLRKVIENKENFWENRLKQLSIENSTLRDQIEKNIGNYRSQNDVIASAISRPSEIRTSNNKLKLVMDKIETSSNASDSPSSNLSSLSGLTGFEEELYHIKSLHSKTQPFFMDSFNNNHYNEHNVSAINEKYKNDLCNIERRIELANHERFDKLLKHNLQLEAELSACKKRILSTKDTVASKQQVEYELELKVSEINRLRNRSDHLEALHNTLKLKYEEIKLDLEMKSTSVAGLKNKIVDLHVETQTLNLNKMKLSNDLHIMHNNFNSLKKSEAWYKEQLHISRSQKSVLARELTQIRSTLTSKEHELKTRSSECLRLNNLLEEAHNRSSKPETENNKASYDHTIQSLTTELIALKKAVETQQAAFDHATKENTDLQLRNTQLMKDSEDKDSLIANLENDRKDLSNKLEILELKLKDVSDLVLKMVTDKSEIEVALVEARREKGDVESAINVIRTDFSKFVDRFNNTKAELFSSNCINERLKEEKGELEQANRKLANDLKRLSNIESRYVIERERVLALEKFVEELQSCEKNLKDEGVKRLQEFDAFKQKFVEVQRVKELLQSENLQLREQITKKDKQTLVLRSLKQRLKHIESRCKNLHSQNLADEEEISALKTNTHFKVEDESECVKNLRALCRAKDLEIKEKREQYERNYRTLLRKVKENVRGRNTAEKRCLYIQERHNSSVAELNSCKLQAASLNIDFVNLQTECRHLKDSLANTNIEVTRLNKEIQEYKMNDSSFKDTIAQLEDKIVTCKNQLREKQKLIEELKADLNNKDVVYNRLEHETQQALIKIADLGASKNELESLLQHETNVQKELSESYHLEQRRYAECALQIEETRLLLQQAQTQNDFLLEEVKNLSKDYDRKSNELTEVLEQKTLLEIKSKKEENVVYYLQSDLDTLKRDKNFLQRLCNDLKFALTTTKNQSDVLKKHVKALSMEYSSLPNFLNTPSPRQFDETYITELLQQSDAADQPLNNLQASLNLLKNEMATLRRQVVESFNFKV